MLWLNMSGRVRIRLLSGLAVVLVSGSWVLFYHIWNDIYWRDERYSLVAIDSLDQMELSFNDDGYLSVLVEPAVYAIGADEKYIVLKQHPIQENGGGINRGVTHFYIIERTLSNKLEDREKGVHGPLSKDAFEKQKAALSLPEFSKTFRELE
jgi:hypothetical protein